MDCGLGRLLYPLHTYSALECIPVLADTVRLTLSLESSNTYRGPNH
jgi:hypothetical protein